MVELVGWAEVAAACVRIVVGEVRGRWLLEIRMMCVASIGVGMVVECPTVMMSRIGWAWGM